MKMRVIAALMVMVALLGACSSSGSSGSSPSPGNTASPADVDKQAAEACKAMEKALADTADGSAISGSDAQEFQNTAGLLIRTPEGRTPTTADPIPTWYALGTDLVSLYVAVADQDSATVAQLTPQVRGLCATIPESAQKAAKYTPVPTSTP